MGENYQKRYKQGSHRFPGWDYSGSGFYFITFVTQHRICNLGKIENSKIVLSDYGKIVEHEWHESFKIREELFLDEFQIMPNHIHAIIKLDKADIESIEPNLSLEEIFKWENHSNKQNEFAMRPKSISSFVAGYKSAVNNKIDNFIDLNNIKTPKYNRNNHFFQPDYHDHIIRDKEAYFRIKQYIKNNPKKWEEDRLKG